MERELGATESERKLHSYYTHTSYSHNYYYDDFWSRTERYCAWYPTSCYDFCDWYPYYCDEFCTRYPHFCQPDCVREQYAFYDFLAECGIYSMFGPSWSDHVDQICAEYGHFSDVCLKWSATVDMGFPEMSVQQGEQLWQQSFTRQFDQYSSTFATDGWTADTPDIPLDAITVNVANAYVTGDVVCDETFNASLLDTIPTQDLRTTFVRDEVTNFNIGIQNGNESLVNYILQNLEANSAQDIEDCLIQDFSNWAEPVAP